MTPASQKTLAAAIGILTVITVGVLYGTRQVERSPDTDNPRQFVVRWEDGGYPDGGTVKCIWTTALVSDEPIAVTAADGGQTALPSPLATYGARSDAGPQYVYAHVCMEVADDGGEDPPLPPLPTGMLALEWEQWEESFDAGPQLHVILQGEPGWPCACARYPDKGNCERHTLNFETWEFEWQAASHGATFLAGQWRGSDCYPKACNENSGTSSWPAECGPP